MGFLSVLGHIAKPLIGLVPGGGTVTSALDAANDVLGGIAGARAQAKTAEANTGLSMDRNRLDARALEQRALMDSANIATDRGRLDLDQRKFSDEARGNRFMDALHGALAKNMQDVTVNRPNGVPVIRFSGGARPSALGPEGRAAGDEMVRQSMLALMNGDKFDKLPDPTVLPELEMTPLPHASLLDKILGVAGPALSLGSAVRRSLPQPAPNLTNARENPTLAGATPLTVRPTFSF